MIIKLLILSDNKLIVNKFLLNKKNNIIKIESLDNNNIIKVPIYNMINGIDYIPLSFPFELIIMENNMVFNPYIILSSFINIIPENDFDFFYQINMIIQKEYDLTLVDFDYFLNDTNNFISIMNNNYSYLFTIDYLKMDNIEQFINTFWLYINICKLYTIYTLIRFLNVSSKTLKKETQVHKKIISLSHTIELYRYNLSYNIDEHKMTLSEYINYNNKNITLDCIMIGTPYYIIKNTNPTDTNPTDTNPTDTNLTEKMATIYKVIKINIIKIDKNIITLEGNRVIIFENYLWYYYHPDIIINKKYIYYTTFINSCYSNEIIKKTLNLYEQHSKKICEYYYLEPKLSNLIALDIYLDDMKILKSQLYSDGFFEYITKKYSVEQCDMNKIYEILSILFENYNYPLKANKHELDTNFDHIIYFSLYNYNHIFINTKSYNNNDLLNPNINSIIPIKFKSLYINFLRTLYHITCNDFDSITYNMKFYYDHLYKNIIKIFLGCSNKLSINLFKSLIKSDVLEKIRYIVSTNMILINITNKLSWMNLSKKLCYLDLFYKNDNIIYYQDKLNKNIIPENYDIRLKKIIENPFEMYRYLRKEKDFIRWTKFISSKVIQLYIVPISLSTSDFSLIGKMIYLLFNIKEQNIKDDTYINFINFCNMNNKLILNSLKEQNSYNIQRINIKIREYFPYIKANINLGFLAKQITNNNMITLEKIQNEKLPEIIELEKKLEKITKKYYKYKVKYLNKTKSEITDTTNII